MDFEKAYLNRKKYDYLFNLDLSFIKLDENIIINVLYLPDFVHSIPSDAFNIDEYNSNRRIENRDVEISSSKLKIKNLFIHKGVKHIEAGAFENLKDCNIYFEDGCPIEDYDHNENFSWVETNCKMFFNCHAPINPSDYENKDSELKEKYKELYEIQKKLTIFLTI